MTEYTLKIAKEDWQKIAEAAMNVSAKFMGESHEAKTETTVLLCLTLAKQWRSLSAFAAFMLESD